jgi:hypothetical protein
MLAGCVVPAAGMVAGIVSGEFIMPAPVEAGFSGGGSESAAAGGGATCSTRGLGVASCSLESSHPQAHSPAVIARQKHLIARAMDSL